MKIIEFLREQAKKAGIAETDLQKVFADQTPLAAAEIDDAVANKMSTSLFTIEAAKSNPTLQAHFHSQVLDGVDSLINPLLDEFEFDDDTKLSLKAEKTGKRAAAIARKVRELTEKKSTAATGDKATLQKEINDLNEKLRTAIAEHKKQLDERDANHSAALLNLEIETMLSGYDYALPKEMPANIKVKTAKAIIDQELAQKGLKIMKNGEGLKLVRSENNSDYFDTNHNKVELQGFTRTVLDSAKLLTNAPAGGSQQRREGESQSSGSGQKVNSDALAMLQAAKQDAFGDNHK